MRADGREPDQLREVSITREFTRSSPGSVLVEAGRTRILCTASIEDGVPPFLMNTNRGWLTAEYAMLPGSTGRRRQREGRKGPADSRSLEIGRLIGRSMRAACNLSKLPGRTAWIDCDVIEADGGTRTAAITGSMVALEDAFRVAEGKGWLRGWPVRSRIAAISAGIIDGEPRLDLAYEEDSRADVDLNAVMNADGEFIELQSSAEGATFSRVSLDQMLGLCDKGIKELLEIQDQALGTTT